MTSCHRPRIYRSNDGCCICGAKSSSSRFTASTRYESYFERCFALSSNEQRSGDICNACVLLVKRFRKLPTGSTRCWAHVKDARSGPGLKSMSRIRSRQNLADADYVTSDVCDVTTTKYHSPGGAKLHSASRSAGSLLRNSNSSSMFIDSDYWTPVKTCCGFVYRGHYGDYLIDTGLYHRCDSHGNCRHDNYVVSTATASSVDSGNEDDDDDISPASSSYHDDTLSCDDVAMETSSSAA